MKHLGRKFSATLVACLAVAAFGCSSSTSGGKGGSGGMQGGGNSLTPTDTGYVMDATTGITGSWYIYGDGLGGNGQPPGDCKVKGMHADSECSTVMVAATATGTGFPQDTPGKMCIKGTANKVIGTPPDYSNIFGIGMGLDFNNIGTDDAGAMPGKKAFDATAKKITAFKFTLSGVPAGGGLRVEFPTSETEAAGFDSYFASKAIADGSYTVSMAVDMPTGGNPDLAPSFTNSVPQPDFNPAHLMGVQFHISTNTTSSINVSNFCVSDLSAVITP